MRELALRGSLGSSPRPWGTRRSIGAVRCLDRFIPTPVGNARPGAGCRARASVHPHARGERHLPVLLEHHGAGSSPRPWGTLHHRRQHRQLHRFIPTPVGNADADPRIARGAAVHPHARGERGDLLMSKRRRNGSSPRPWGTHELHQARFDRGRFIPTPVGNARITGRPSSRKPVHPHARGERRARETSGRGCSGSSPRPWGTPPITILLTPSRRFIPTPVGNASAGAG